MPDFEKILEVSLRFETINPQDVNHDHQHYQRDRDENRIDKIVKKAKESKEALAEIKKDHSGILAKRSDGTYWTINGQHHTEACIRLGIDLVEYQIFNSSGWEFEKEVFNKFQHWQIHKE